MKRIVSLLLSLAMIMSLFTTVSFAATDGTEANPHAAGSKVTKVTHEGYYVGYTASKNTATIYHFSDDTPTVDENLFKVTLSGGKAATELSYSSDTLTFKDDKGVYYYIDIDDRDIAVDVNGASGNGLAVSVNDDAKEVYVVGKITENNANLNKCLSGKPMLGATELRAAGNTVKLTVNESGSVIATIPGWFYTKDGTTMNYTEHDTGYTIVEDVYYDTSVLDITAPGVVTKTVKLPSVTLETAAGNFDITSAPTGFSCEYKDGKITKIVCDDTAAIGEDVLEFTDGTYTIYVPVKVTAMDLSQEKDAVHGVANTFAASTLYNAALTRINTAMGTSYKVTQLDLDIPSDANFAFETKTGNADAESVVNTITLYNDGKFGTKNTNTTLIVTPTKNDSVDQTVDVDYTVYVMKTGDATATPYNGTITFTSVYNEKKHSVTAPFSLEDFYLDTFATGVKKIEVEGVEYEKGEYLIEAPGDSHSKDWTETVVGIIQGGEKYQMEVTFNHRTHDLQTTVQDGDAPFAAKNFVSFLQSVVYEQNPTYKAVAMDKVVFTKTSSNVSGEKWALVKPTGASFTSGLTATQLEDVTIDVTNAGTYDIPFKMTYKYKTSTSAPSWSETSDTVEGIIRVIAGKTIGKVQYTVEAGKTVSLKASDFKSLYKNLTSSGVLGSVTIDSLPAAKYGTLYDSDKLTNTYAVRAGEVYDINSSVDEVSEIAFWASDDITSKSTATFAVTMDGTDGSVSTDVEITITEKVFFTDVAKGSTFYDYVVYVSENGIMGGKSATRFDVKSNISRIQLIVTLYRMADSPSTYNNRTLPFSDTKNLSTEFTNALKWAYAKGIATGSNGKFNPNSAVTRQALVTILYRYAQSEDYVAGATSSNHLARFTDGAQVSSGMKDAMNWAIDNGLLNGSGNKLNPGNGTTRGAAAKILANFHSTYVD